MTTAVGKTTAAAGSGKTGKDPVPLSMVPTLAPPMQAKLDPGTSAKTSPKNPTSGAGATPPPGSSQNHPASPIGSAPAPTGPAGEDAYPVIGTLETAVFGAPGPTKQIDDRLSKLENAVFRKTFPDQSLFDRTERLKATLLGVQQPFDLDPASAVNRSQFVEAGGQAMQSYYDDLAMRPENQVEVSDDELQRFYIELINAERQKFGFGPLAADELACKVAKDHDDELCRRGVVSHQDMKGNNPDRRYTLAGGTDLLFESIVSLKTDDPENRKRNRATVARMVKTVLQRQDERDSLLAADATGIGFALNWTADKDRVVACSNIVTHHGVLQPIANTCMLGDKLEVKGAVMEPYKFDRVTLAWEANNGKLSSVADESDEALPYFAPLDYAAFAKNSEHDYSTALTVLRTAGIIAAIAGGVFMPPVALAAPMIAMSGGMGGADPKPVSDIPVKGGVHVDGNVFSAKVPINHEGKEGLYYVTVWASVSKYGKPIPISRRAILATTTPETSESVSAQVEDDPQPPKKHKSHSK
jgi:hypothetical protein